MNRIIATALTALLCVSGMAAAHERIGASGRAPTRVDLNQSEGRSASSKGKVNKKVNDLKELEKKLDEEFELLKKEGVASATPMYAEAKGRIKSAIFIAQPNPGTKEAALAFSACSAHVAAVLLQFEREMNLVKARKKAAERDSLLTVLHGLHEAISRIEGGRAYRLSQELEATRGKAAGLQSDLEATSRQAADLQADLQATQADLDAAQANLAAERERLRQVMEDAQKRLRELQSDLINVSRDARGTIISMSDILFETGRANLTANLQTNLARIAGILMVYKEPNILVEGHTDNVGSRELNQKLSEDRATNVMNFLGANGVGAERMTAIGSAFDKPVADNSTPEGRAKNRRVDLIIMEEELDYGQNESAAE
ncbi:MAG: OmpA family protein [Chitinispirillia bacterium]|nr:OmpA family protein [Chitinispirillia bacterium]